MQRAAPYHVQASSGCNFKQYAPLCHRVMSLADTHSPSWAERTRQEIAIVSAVVQSSGAMFLRVSFPTRANGGAPRLCSSATYLMRL